MGIQLQAVKTPLTIETAAPALKSALTQKLGREPNQFLFLILLATIWMETGAGKSVYHNNVGNVTVGASGADYYMVAGNSNHFRVYATLTEGILGYLYEILRRGAMTQNAIEGRVYDYLVQYRDSRYCPDCDPNKLLPTFEKLIAQFKAAKLELDLPTSTWVFALPKPTPPVLPLPSSPLPGDCSTGRPELLKLGAHGETVVFWQRVVGCQQLDGDFGPQTAKATRAFQRAHSLPETGFVDALTWLKALPLVLK
jgi:peptidoglycan hydrolase-like protein with peptidoglycan-binding domain